MKSAKPGRSKGCKLHSVRRADLDMMMMNLPDLPWWQKEYITIATSIAYRVKTQHFQIAGWRWSQKMLPIHSFTIELQLFFRCIN